MSVLLLLESHLDDEDANPSNDGYKALGANARASTRHICHGFGFQLSSKSNRSMKIGSPHTSPQKSRILGTSDFPSPNVEKIKVTSNLQYKKILWALTPQ